MKTAPILRGALLAALLSLATTASGQSTEPAVPASPSVPVQQQPEPQAIPQAGTTDAQGILTEATVVVTGRQPGPGLWRVSKGEHELYILGTLSPLPANMEWETREVEEVIARSQEVIRPPYITVGSDVSKLRMLTLLPSLIGIRDNPGGKTLKQVLPADVYTRWQAYKAQFLPDNRKVEKMRPVLAAAELYKAAIKRSGMSMDDAVMPMVSAAIKQHNPKVTVPKVELKINDVKEIRSTIRQFKASQIEDLQCMSRTLDVIGQDLETMRRRANAWAGGDIDALQALPVSDQYSACMDAIGESAIGRKLGLGDMQEQVRRLWLEKAEAALASNATTFAVLPLSSMLERNGLLQRLRDKGYEVEAPY